MHNVIRDWLLAVPDFIYEPPKENHRRIVATQVVVEAHEFWPAQDLNYVQRFLTGARWNVLLAGRQTHVV
jgi:hypothetical protein